MEGGKKDRGGRRGRIRERESKREKQRTRGNRGKEVKGRKCEREI